jgi:hypothetical protein
MIGGKKSLTENPPSSLKKATANNSIHPTNQNPSLTFPPVSNSNSYYSPHKHSGVTTHLVLSGELTVSYPDDAQPAKETIGVGGRFDVEAGRRHEVWVGSEGCTYVIGE